MPLTYARSAPIDKQKICSANRSASLCYALRVVFGSHQSSSFAVAARSAGLLAFVCGIAISACGGGGSDGPNDGGPNQDGGPGGNQDGGSSDDGGVNATRVGEQGFGCRNEVPRCNSGLSCINLGLSRAAIGGDAINVGVCERQCQTDLNCLDLPDTPLCRPIGLLSVCVSAEVQEGERATMIPPITGCAIGLESFRWNEARSPLLGLQDYEFSCGRPCDPEADPPGGCTAQFPFCNPQVVDRPGAPGGVCALRRAEGGDLCSTTSVVGLCDTSTTPAGNLPEMLCLRIPPDDSTAEGSSILDTTDPSKPDESGICFALCDPKEATPDCSHVSDTTAGPTVCAPFGMTTETSSVVGLCSHGCTLFPDNCGRPSTLGHGSACTGPLTFVQGSDPVSLCRSVVPELLPEYNFIDLPKEDCLFVPGGTGRCPANTHCVDTRGAGGLCLRDCMVETASVTESGCAASTVGNTTCRDDLFLERDDGLGYCGQPQ